MPQQLHIISVGYAAVSTAVAMSVCRFGHVVSCAMDVRSYLPLLTGDTRSALSRQLQQRAEQAAEELQQQQGSSKQQLNLLRLQMAARQVGECITINGMYVCVCISWIQHPAGYSLMLVVVLKHVYEAHSRHRLLVRRVIGASSEKHPNCCCFCCLCTLVLPTQIHADLGGPTFDSPQAAAQHAFQLMALYAAALPHYEGLDERERGPADELLWLAAAALVKAAALETTQQQQQGSASGIGYLLQALLVQEAAAKGRPYCAPVRLGLTGLQGLLGNARAAAQHFGALDVKHIQHDTLSGQHLLPLQLGLGARDAAEGLLRVSLALFEDHLRDAGDTLMQAFRTGTHTKVGD
jgi:hypothetical protein